MTAKWTAIAREAGLAAEHLGIGITAIGRATYAFPAYYSQAFFALSVGLERSCKLALAVDYAIQNRGNFPTEKLLRSYGHDIDELLRACNDLSRTRYPTVPRIPNTIIHASIVSILSAFASNITRYYNVKVITESQKTDDPLRQWYELVVKRVIEEKCSPKSIKCVLERAEIIDAMSSSFTLVRQTAESGEPIDTVRGASAQTGLTKLSTPYVRLHILQIIRPIAYLMAELGYSAQAAHLEDVPYLCDFFTIFMADDAYFKRRKVWSTYPTYPAS